MTISTSQLVQSITALKSSELPVIAGRTTITYQFLTTGTNATYRAGDYSTGLTQNATVLAIQNLMDVGGTIVPVASVRALTQAVDGVDGEQEILVSIFSYLETILNVKFVNLTGTLDANGQPVRNANIRLAAAAFGESAGGINARKANGAPNYTNDVFFSTNAFTSLSEFPGKAYFRGLAMHEIGHALGLKHSFYEAIDAAAGFVPPDYSNTLYTQMAYDYEPIGMKGARVELTSKAA